MNMKPAITAGITVATMHSNARYYQAAQVCIERGGTWVPLSSGACIVR